MKTLVAATSLSPGRRVQSAQRLVWGRPPQSSVSDTVREKVTVQISSDLINRYRDWSWDARTSLSALVETAMTDHFKRCRK